MLRRQPDGAEKAFRNEREPSMHLKTIVSGGQTGADRAALDTAIRMGVDHGGWVPRGRLAEDGPLDGAYALRETASSDPAERTEKNVVDADGTLIVSHGPLRGGSAYTRECAEKHGRPWLHADLAAETVFSAALRINGWIASEGISVLNVAGPRASKDPRIYRATADLLETLFLMDAGGLTASAAGADGPAVFPPSTVEEALRRLEGALDLRDKVRLARMDVSEPASAFPELVRRIRSEFRLPLGNPKLLASCREAEGEPEMAPAASVAWLVRRLRDRLRQTHGLRRLP
jgi:hypothetical protein